jgi:hypothetical protein
MSELSEFTKELIIPKFIEWRVVHNYLYDFDDSPNSTFYVVAGSTVQEILGYLEALKVINLEELRIEYIKENNPDEYNDGEPTIDELAQLVLDISILDYGDKKNTYTFQEMETPEVTEAGIYDWDIFTGELQKLNTD